MPSLSPTLMRMSCPTVPAPSSRCPNTCTTTTPTGTKRSSTPVLVCGTSPATPRTWTSNHDYCTKVTVSDSVRNPRSCGKANPPGRMEMVGPLRSPHGRHRCRLRCLRLSVHEGSRRDWPRPARVLGLLHQQSHLLYGHQLRRRYRLRRDAADVRAMAPRTDAD